MNAQAKGWLDRTIYLIYVTPLIYILHCRIVHNYYQTNAEELTFKGLPRLCDTRYPKEQSIDYASSSKTDYYYNYNGEDHPYQHHPLSI